jgi:hypothetical protein
MLDQNQCLDLTKNISNAHGQNKCLDQCLDQTLDQMLDQCLYQC